MTVLETWERRPSEEAHLFNPAFCGSLAYEFLKSYTVAAGRGSADLPLVFCALPICLHLETRQRLPSSTRTSVYTWLQREPGALVGYADRARDLAPYLKQGVSFGFSRETFAFDTQGASALGDKKATFTPGFLHNATAEVREIVLSARMLGRWFAGAGTTATILAAWGITV